MIPPRKEQQKIVEVLGIWDQALDALSRLLAAQQERRQWLFQQLLTGKRRLPGFNKNWSKSSVGDITEECSIRNQGYLNVESVRAVNKTEGMVPMKSHVIADDISRYKVIRRFWFAYNPMRINIGSICQWMGDEDALVSPDYVVFRCKEDRIDHNFFDAFRQSYRWTSFMEAAGNGSVRIRIYYDDLARLTFQLPPIEEQRKIAFVLDNAAKEIDLLKAHLDALREQKKGLMQKLLTSKLRVKVPKENLTA